MAPVIMGNPDRPELGEELTNSFCRTNPEIAKHFARATFLSDNRADLPKLVSVEDAHDVMVDRIAGMVARADRALVAGARLDPTDLRGWHYVISGGMLAHLSPHGFAEACTGGTRGCRTRMPCCGWASSACAC